MIQQLLNTALHYASLYPMTASAIVLTVIALTLLLGGHSRRVL